VPSNRSYAFLADLLSVMLRFGPRKTGLALMCAAMSFVTLTFSMLYVLVPLMSVDLGASPVMVGSLVSSGHVLPLLLAMRLGRLVDRIGGRRVLTFGAVGTMLMPLAVVLAPSLPALAVTQFVSGLFNVCLAVASQSLVASLGDERTHERNFAWYMTFLSVGQLGGPIAAGVIVDTHGYQVAFGSLIVTSAITLVSVGIIHRLDIIDITPGGGRLNCPGFDGGSPLTREERMGYAIQV